MSKNYTFRRGHITNQRWSQALDVTAYDRQYAAVIRYLREDVHKISLMEAERRSGLCHQFWSKVEKGESHPSSHNEVLMANALRVRPHVIHRLAERWTRLGRRLQALWLSLLPWFERGEPVVAGA
ncbi:MAG: helix-turn-helix transcriptional regulator [Verrucomicrobiaceae bacterium]|nr:helix-turn-helix transcriptional regulator [Verrucomicrobiaceae bacterium]